jgi:hypothetical protein
MEICLGANTSEPQGTGAKMIRRSLHEMFTGFQEGIGAKLGKAPLVVNNGARPVLIRSLVGHSS